MSLTRHATPEVFFTDTLHRVETYYNLSVQYAEAGDSLSAVNALWASDVSTVQMIAWERIIIASPNPDKQFFQVASTVAKALSVYAVSNPGFFRSAQEVIESARNGLEAAFDESFLALLRGRYAPSSHLHFLPAPLPEDIVAARDARLHGLTPEEFILSRRADAAASMAESRNVLTAGDVNGAIENAYNSDMLAFEAYLVESAMAVGDEGLLTVPLRLDMASAYISELPGLPYDVVEAVDTIRAALARAVGPAEASRLDVSLLPVDAY